MNGNQRSPTLDEAWMNVPQLFNGLTADSGKERAPVVEV